MSLVWAIASLLLCSAVYEPVRNALHNLGEEVGGVGGVGGLTNLGNPGTCTSAAGKAEAYCFREGLLLGLTPFACIFLALWVLPFCVVACLQKPKGEPDEGRFPLTEGGSHLTGMPDTRKGIVFMWVSLSFLWFSVPLAAYSSSDFYQQDAWHVVLAIAIAAAFPLSWHLSLVAVPVPPFIAELMHMSRKDLLGFHKMVAYATCFWAVLHAGGELIWFLSQGSLMASLNFVANGENLLYVCGMITAALLTVHVGISQVRHKLAYFKQMHGCLAAALLLAAAAHWWPFTFFLIPAAGVHATSVSLKLFEPALAAQDQEIPRAATSCIGKALSCATLAATVTTSLVWRLRQSYMMSSNAGLCLPFLFPPVALLAGFGAAVCASSAVIKMFI